MAKKGTLFERAEIYLGTVILMHVHPQVAQQYNMQADMRTLSTKNTEIVFIKKSRWRNHSFNIDKLITNSKRDTPSRELFSFFPSFRGGGPVISIRRVLESGVDLI